MTVESAKFKGKANDLYLQKNSAGQVVSGFNLLNVVAFSVSRNIPGLVTLTISLVGGATAIVTFEGTSEEMEAQLSVWLTNLERLIN
jgi:uncharacterized protein (DUF697 family)